MNHTPNSLGSLTVEERAAFDQTVAAILGHAQPGNSGNWVAAAAEAADRALAWIELRRRLIPRDRRAE